MVPTVNYTPYSGYDPDPCYHQKNHDSADLCAQWRAAKAAEDSALWAERGFWITVIGSFLLLCQIVLTRKAVVDTGEATKAMVKQNELTFAAQRPWITLSCRIKKLIKTENSIFLLAVVTFENVGDMVAENFYFRASPQLVHNENVATANDLWLEYRRNLEIRHNVLLPKEAMDTEVSISASTAHPHVFGRGGVAGEYDLLVVAAAHYRISGDERWHITERSFLVGLVDDSGVEGIEWFTPQIENREYAANELKTRLLHSGETS